MRFFQSAICGYSCWVLCAQVLGAQTDSAGLNLVRNPSFEQNTSCPNDQGQLDLCNFWSSAIGPAPDYFHHCSENTHWQAKVPDNFYGSQRPSTGKAYCGLTAMSFNDEMDMKFGSIQVRLTNPLVAGQSYCLKAQVALAERASIALPVLHMSFQQKRTYPDEAAPTSLGSARLVGRDSFLADKTDWMEISGNYRASGGEEWLVLSFQMLQENDLRLKTLQDSPGHVKGFAYYYIDDVCVSPLSNNWQCNCGSFERRIQKRILRLDVSFRERLEAGKPGQDVVLEGVNFPNDSDVPTPASLPMLDTVANWLATRPELFVEIVGHTDSVGDDEHNRQLSEGRAKAVYLYLVQKGISPERMQWRGAGEKEPAFPNDTEANRARNRRVALRKKN